MTRRPGSRLNLLGRNQRQSAHVAFAMRLRYGDALEVML